MVEQKRRESEEESKRAELVSSYVCSRLTLMLLIVMSFVDIPSP